eukprot:4284673-Pleurochrysis_carterae.AAC.1
MRRARYVAALRKTEGFELFGIEGLFCGARPLVYNLSTYRWYGGHAVFVPADATPADLFLFLTDALRRPPTPVTKSEMAVLHTKFSWRRIVPALFEQVRTELERRRERHPD